jgi:hypothetical protein
MVKNLVNDEHSGRHCVADHRVLRSLEDELRLLAESCCHFRLSVADSKRGRGDPHLVPVNEW